MKCSVIYKHYLHDARLKWRQRMLTKYNLVELQNHPANISQDHLTICGFFETEEAFRIHAKHLKDEISYDFLSDPRDPYPFPEVNIQDMLTKYNLVELQNHPANISQDHLTICCDFETEEEFLNLANRLKERTNK